MASLRFITPVISLLIFLGVPGKSGADEMLYGTVPHPNTTGFAEARGGIRVVQDFARILRLAEPARTVIIGSPGILDATIHDERTLVLTGKAVGATNLIILDEAGAEISNLMVHVAPSDARLVSVHSGAEVRTYSCVENCKPTVSVGDVPQHLDTARTQIQGRQEFSAGRAANQ